MTGIKIDTAKGLLDRVTFIVTIEAAAWIATYFSDAGEEIASEVIERMGQGNESRRMNGLPPRKKTTAEDARSIFRWAMIHYTMDQIIYCFRCAPSTLLMDLRPGSSVIIE